MIIFNLLPNPKLCLISAVRLEFIATTDPCVLGLQYLGSDLEELSGCTLYDDHSVVSLPLLIQQYGTVAMPGQTLPLSLYHPHTITLLRQAIEKDRTFGLVVKSQSVLQQYFNDPEKHPLIGTVGVTAEIYEHRDTPDLYRGYGLKARCRQRFKILEVTEHHDM